MKPGYRQGIVCSNIQIATNIYEMKIDLTHEGSSVLGSPGQFYMLKSWDLDPFLPRPISIANIEENKVVFLYEIRGKGTGNLSQLKSGDSLEVLGPLGNGFDLNINGKIAIITGGIGIAPMIYLSKVLKANIDFYCGFRNEAYYIDEIKNHVNNIYITTEDGSVGHKGFVTELFKPENYTMALTCGPPLMMKKVVEMAEDKIPVFVSMESRMACGIGACLGCTVETTLGMERVCKEGPVFSGEEVVFVD